MPSIDIYSSSQVSAIFGAKADISQLPSADQLLPSASGASEGMTLKLNANLTPYWG